MTTPRRWSLVYEAWPISANAHRRLAPHDRARVDREWRDAFAMLARAQRIPRLELVAVDAWPIWPNRRSLPDPGNAYPVVKAALDGIVDAGVIPDDTGAHVDRITLHRPDVEAGHRHALRVTITEVLAA